MVAKILIVLSLFMLGCSSQNKDITVIHMKYDRSTGIARGYVISMGETTKIVLMPEDTKLIKDKAE